MALPRYTKPFSLSPFSKKYIFIYIYIYISVGLVFSGITGAFFTGADRAIISLDKEYADHYSIYKESTPKKIPRDFTLEDYRKMLINHRFALVGKKNFFFCFPHIPINQFLSRYNLGDSRVRNLHLRMEETNPNI